MANLFEIDQAIMNCIDLETGEVIDPEGLNTLQMERDAKIEGVACWIKNLMADAAAYKAEKEAFAEREKAATKKAESLKIWLSDILQGQKFSTVKCAVSFRKSTACEIADETQFIDNMDATGHYEYLTYKAPTINKTAVKDALKLGKRIEGAELVERSNISIK